MVSTYQVSFREALSALKREGRYRVFADILRERGHFPKAGLHDPDATYTDNKGRPITVWCSTTI